MSGIVRFLNQRLGGYGREALVAGKATLSRSCLHSTKFIMFGRGRSGSTLLTSMLNQSELVNCDKEIFNRPVLFPRQFLKNRSSIQRGEIYGFKLLSYQLRNQFGVEDGKRFLNELTSEQDYKLIFMKRENLVKQTLSKHYARHRGAWHSSKKVQQSNMVVDVEAFIKELHEGRKLDFLEEEILQGIPKFDVIYEQDLEEREAQLLLIKRICGFLQIPEYTPEIKLKKIGVKKVAQYVSNWTELKLAIENSEFSSHLSSIQ